VTISSGTFAFVADLVRRRSAVELTVGKEYLVETRLLPLVLQADLAGVDEYVDTCACARTAPNTIVSSRP
jgi:chemotaxis protein methyltransferase CheR